MTKVTIYTDGAARGNPDGPGGYGAVLLFTDSAGTVHRKELSEGFPKTTNNRMELMAAIAGLEALTRPCEVELHSDSQYLINAFTKGWIESWKKRDWKKADRSPVLNRDLWERLLAELVDMVSRNVHVVEPDMIRLVVIDIDRRIQSVWVKADALGQKLPGPRNGLLLEIIAEGEISEHFEKCPVARGFSYIFKIACADALLARRHSAARRNLLTRKPRLHRSHARVDNEQ